MGLPQNSLELAAQKGINWYNRGEYWSRVSVEGGPMREREPDSNMTTKDRRLGDEWLDWNGATNPAEKEIDERRRTFLVLAAATVVMMIAALELFWYLAKPRIEQLSLFLSRTIEWSAFVLLVLFLLFSCLEITLLIRFKKSVFPYIWAEKFLLSLLSKSIWLGQKFGISRDRVGNSFIKVHNLLLKSHKRLLKGDMLLILLPRCLEKETKRQVVERVNGRAVQIVTAAGGEEARKAIRQHRPSLILAVACERDLISGIRDVAEKIPVLAIPNKRPEGPCKNTKFYLTDLDEALKFIADSASCTPSPEIA
jgi:hypothetical protein